MVFLKVGVIATILLTMKTSPVEGTVLRGSSDELCNLNEGRYASCSIGKLSSFGCLL